MTTNKLHVYIDKVFAGTLEQNINGGALSFIYDSEYILSKNHSRLSISLPVRPEPFDDKVVRAFFSGLLPDNEQLDLLAKQLKASPKNPFAILSKIGRDCAGAIEILTPSEKPINYGDDGGHPLSEEELYKIINEVYTNPLLAGGGRKIRLSLAGAQSKLAVFFDEKKNSLPKLTDGSPSTHILKPIMPHFSDSVHNEFFCMRLAKKVNLDVAEVFLKFAKEKPYLLIRRYDRVKNSKGLITRIHQEDFCQALGLMPEMKYQGVDGGPGIAVCMDLIKKNSLQPAKDILKFVNAIVFNYLIGNSDAHGKNFSFLYQNNLVRLAPLYDLVCTGAHKQLDQKMAMKIGRVSDPSRLSLRSWHSLFPNNQSAKLLLNKTLENFAKTLPSEADLLKKDLETQEINSPIFDDIINVINKRSAKILGYFG